MTTYSSDREDSGSPVDETTENSSAETDTHSKDPNSQTEEEYAEIAFEEFPEAFQEIVKERLQTLGTVGVTKKGMREVTTSEDVDDVFEATASQINSLELILTTPAQSIPFHYIINTHKPYAELFFNYDVVQTILMTQHGKDVLPNDTSDLSVEEFMKNLEKYKPYILSDARSRSGLTARDINKRISLVQANSTGALQLDSTQFGDISYLQYSDRIFNPTGDSYPEDAYRRINNFENVIRAYIGLFQNTYVTTSRPLLDVMLDDGNAEMSPPTQQTTDRPGIGFQ
jgi:hypothetical protein